MEELRKLALELAEELKAAKAAHYHDYLWGACYGENQRSCAHSYDQLLVSALNETDKEYAETVAKINAINCTPLRIVDCN